MPGLRDALNHDLEPHAALHRGGRCDERHARKRTRAGTCRLQRAGGAGRRHAPFPNAGPKVEPTTLAITRQAVTTARARRTGARNQVAFGGRHAPVSVRARLAHEPTASEDAGRRWRNLDARTGRVTQHAERAAGTSEHAAT